MLGPDGEPRCAWSGAAPELLAYHDTEWDFPVGDDQRLFEKLSLEGFQSGLSWRTILAERENFRSAFAAFDIPAVARFDRHDVERLLGDAGIVRHRGETEAVINNARRAEELIEREGSLAAFLWHYEPDATTLAEPQTASASPASVAPCRGPEEARLEVRRADHGVRVHTGHVTDQRPRPGLHDPAQGPADS
ncbi:DNA-3-methyladenine glycosylase I [Streptomyces triticiradicis]|nr:DNA-3-methyladenine glycosylase I [Streptomyces triticiradicis]